MTLVLCLLLFTLIPYAQAYPRSFAEVALAGRGADPVFPPSPPSCPLCAKDWPTINNCAQACPLFANFSMIIYNPGAFIDVIQCSCTETFSAAFPQCVDCFLQTNQSEVLEAKDLPGVLDGIRRVCAIKSTLLGGAAYDSGQATRTTGFWPRPTATSRAGRVTSNHHAAAIGLLSSLLALGALVL